MFGKIASDVLGISDIGKIIDPKDFNKVDVDDYIFHEDNEQIFFVIKSKTDEYCFSSLAFTHLDGDLAVSKKKTLNRYDYSTYTIQNVRIETAGTIDLDCELKFTIKGNGITKDFSIDIDKKQEEAIKDIYKSLYKISAIQKENSIKAGHIINSIETAKETLKNAKHTNVEEAFRSIAEFTESWYERASSLTYRKDFSEVFELYINN